ncbi:MAG: hypothetical protein FJ100_19675 [Deltaproteobacteria bacterium]|nr:hypothetical protein [Deltaproteobacteria bacterium]
MATPGYAAKPKKKAPQATPAAEAVPPVTGDRKAEPKKADLKKAESDGKSAPGEVPAAPAPAKPPAAEPARPAEPAKTVEPPKAAEPAPAPVPSKAPPGIDADAPKAVAADSVWAGFFFQFGFGYASHGGQAGPQIPAVKGTLEYHGQTYKGSLKMQDLQPFGVKYNELVRTDVGSGMAAMLQFGYNVAGYVSLWLDIAAHGTISTDKKSMSGGGGISFLAGVHPLRFVRPDLPVDTKLYYGYTPLDVLAYNENQIQPDYKAKAWLGPATPFGLHTEWKPKVKGAFALGLDLRMVHASYNQWYYNWDKEQYSSPGTDGTAEVTTLRFEPRLTLAAHF